MQVAGKINYLVSGLTGRLSTSAACPACGDCNGRLIARKWFHSLLECPNCRLLHRYPVESQQHIDDLYDHGYEEPGLTTQLPSDDALEQLVTTGFKGSPKDFSYHASILSALGLAAGGRLLDYGANWGYASWQFARHGFDVTSFEISRPRAAYGRKLGLAIETEIARVGTGFDMVYSCHVLEHTPNPRTVLLEQLDLVKPGGLVVAHTPNGSALHRQSSPGFNLTWGYVHPVLLTDDFVRHVAGARPYLVGSDDRPENVKTWDRATQLSQPADDSGLFLVIRRVD